MKSFAVVQPYERDSSQPTKGARMENPFNQGYFSTEQLRGFGFKDVGKNVIVAKNCTIVGLRNISIADNVRIDGNTVIAAASGSITIGSYIHIGGGCFLACAGGITLGDFSGLSQGVRIYSATDDYTGHWLTNPTVPHAYVKLKVAPVVLGRHVIIGAGTVILPGVTIGEGSSVGALSLVSKALDPWGVYFGLPVKRLKARSKRLLELEKQLRQESAY